MAMMDVCGPVLCPNCSPQKNRRGLIIGVYLQCSENNYSGCGVDMANCPNCGKGFQISYKIDKITPEPSWDIDFEAEASADKRLKEHEIEELEKRLKELKK